MAEVFLRVSVATDRDVRSYRIEDESSVSEEKDGTLIVDGERLFNPHRGTARQTMAKFKTWHYYEITTHEHEVTE